MARYVWRDGEWKCRKTGEPMRKPFAGQICRPYYTPDIPEYLSPIDGQPITSRTHRREDLLRNDCYEVDPPQKPRGFRNPHFAKKHGVPLTEDAPHKDVEKERAALAARAKGIA